MAHLTYKYRIYPTKNQIYGFNTYFELCALLRSDLRKDFIDKNKLPGRAVDILPHYLYKYPDLAKASRGVLISEIFKINEGHSKYSFSFSYLKGLQERYPIQDDKFYIPGIGWVKKKDSRIIQNHLLIKTFTITKKKNKYFLYAVLDIPEIKKELNTNSIIGFDYSSKHFLIDNNGKQYNIPNFYKEAKKKIDVKLHRLKNCKKGSNTYKILKKEIRDLYEEERNRRIDTLQKISTSIVNKYDYIVIEDLSMKNIASFHNLHNATYNNSFYRFTKMLEYKAECHGKKLIKVDRYFPSTKTCHKCKFVNHNLTINDRVWICPSCGLTLDRDINSAINIKNEGLKIIADGRSACL